MSYFPLKRTQTVDNELSASCFFSFLCKRQVISKQADNITLLNKNQTMSGLITITRILRILILDKRYQKLIYE